MEKRIDTMEEKTIQNNYANTRVIVDIDIKPNEFFYMIEKDLLIIL